MTVYIVTTRRGGVTLAVFSNRDAAFAYVRANPDSAHPGIEEWEVDSEA
jgi:hypothetical protein